nr:hypothetical protein BaRGS_032391 [Batillaria attramentaria]
MVPLLCFLSLFVPDDVFDGDLEENFDDNLDDEDLDDNFDIRVQLQYTNWAPGQPPNVDDGCVAMETNQAGENDTYNYSADNDDDKGNSGINAETYYNHKENNTYDNHNADNDYDSDYRNKTSLA